MLAFWCRLQALWLDFHSSKHPNTLEESIFPTQYLIIMTSKDCLGYPHLLHLVISHVAQCQSACSHTLISSCAELALCLNKVKIASILPLGIRPLQQARFVLALNILFCHSVPTHNLFSVDSANVFLGSLLTPSESLCDNDNGHHWAPAVCYPPETH